jgi:hypothetical protein
MMKKSNISSKQKNDTAVKAIPEESLATTSERSIKASEEYIRCLADFETFINESKNIIKGHCDTVRATIDVNYESILDKLCQQKDALMNRLTFYENDCMNEVEGKMKSAHEFLNEQTNNQNIKLLWEKKAEYKFDLFKNKALKYIESEFDPQIILGYLDETLLECKNKFYFLDILNDTQKPDYKFSLDVDKIDPQNEMSGEFEYYVVSFGIDRFVICILLQSKFQLRLLQKRGDLIRMHTFQPPSEFLSFCSNTTRLFMLANQDNIKVLYEFDENLLLRRVKEVNDNSIKVSCDNNFVFLLVEKCIDTFCGFCFEIYTDSIQEIERGSFKFMKLRDPSINMDYNMSPETRLEIYSQDDDTFVFYIDEQTKIEVFSKDKYMTSLIELKHKINPSDAFIFTNERNLIQVFYKFQDTWYLVDKTGDIVKFRKYDCLKNTDKFCVTRDGNLVLCSKELNIQLF